MPPKRAATAQRSLFESGAGVLADDERGTITYTPGFAPAPVAEAWFQQLRESIQWKAERRRMYDRDVDVPRLTAHFRLVTEEGENAAVPAPIREAARAVLTRTGVPFTSVGLNRYRDGRDSVAPHNDHLSELVEGFPIGLLSLGAPRRMTIRTKEAPPRRLFVDLESGSLLMMSYATQLHYTHGVPKVAHPVGERISLAFRVKPVRAPSEDDTRPDFYR